MKIKDISFIGSFASVKACPKPKLPEFAFTGRSNVGKSSLINMLTHRKNIARISNTPGKTQTLNFFLVNEEYHLVDLPGYGYSKVSKTKKREWENFIRDYLKERMTLQCVFLLVDSRISVQKSDIEFANWLGELEIPFVIVFTKVDKLKKHIKESQIENFKKAMLEYWQFLPQFFITSSKTKHGKEELLNFIDEVLHPDEKS